MDIPQSSNKKRKWNKESISNNKQLSADAWFRAVHDGNLVIIERFLDSGWDVNAQRKGGGTALHVAARNGHFEIVKSLLEHGADVNAKTEDHRTALHLAAQTGHLEIVKLLLEHGADVNAKTGWLDDWGRLWTALHLAAKNGRLEIVKFLLEHGADVNAKTDVRNIICCCHVIFLSLQY
jgi:ankyrin repeat protein